ncbi:glycosyltransferase family 39 protein [Patulibacter minatonensis]|uniref:glycosyltransferase family 39 protein n=1 Tax=Patulibacter minatonensis TaxID=298163 RepID=UPI00047E87C4|nr:glycosyltransferase family 39 protein [Patulibacter minatonensis]
MTDTVSSRPTSRSVSIALPWATLAVVAVCVFGVVLRAWDFSRTPPNPFYDAAVRSMGLSWHNFFYGAFEPGGSVSVDKAPIDLWLQVASTKLLGFSSVTLRLPQVIAGSLAIPLLYDLVRRGFGRRAGLVAASALAVLPIAVLTSRSDTMDTLMGTVLLAALWTIAAAPPERRRRAVVGAGALAGLAFEIKLFQAMVAIPAIAAMAWWALDDLPSRRIRTLQHAAIAFVVVAAAWPVAASLAPGHHPFPLGATDGTIANVILIYNGLDRLGYPAAGALNVVPPGPFRLLTTTHPDYLGMIGTVLVPALLLGGLAIRSAAVARKRTRTPRALDPAARTRVAVGVGIGVWLLCGFLLFSVQGRVRMRYLEAFTPSVAATFGIGLSAWIGALARRHDWRPHVSTYVVALLTAGLLAAPLLTSMRLVRTGAEDSQTLGAIPAAQVESVSRYLHAHQPGARYEFASSGSIVAGPLIARDGEPVLMLTGWWGRQQTTPAQLEAKVRTGEVRHLLLDETGCRSPHDASCSPVMRWALAHATDVSAQAGLAANPFRRLVRLHV